MEVIDNVIPDSAFWENEINAWVEYTTIEAKPFFDFELIS